MTRTCRSDPVNIREINPPTPGQVADWTGVEELQRKMVEAIESMQALADEVGTARTILEFSSDRRKRALARACSAALAGGESVAKAESQARADEAYGKELSVLQREHEAAEQAIANWDVLKITWSGAQSLLAMQRETVKHL